MLISHVPVHRRMASASVAQGLLGKSGRSHTVGFGPADTENTGKSQPDQNL